MGAAFVVAGLPAAIAAAVLLDATHAYAALTRGLGGFAFLTTVGLVFAATQGDALGLYGRRADRPQMGRGGAATRIFRGAERDGADGRDRRAPQVLRVRRLRRRVPRRRRGGHGGGGGVHLPDAARGLDGAPLLRGQPLVRRFHVPRDPSGDGTSWSERYGVLQERRATVPTTPRKRASSLGVRVGTSSRASWRSTTPARR